MTVHGSNMPHYYGSSGNKPNEAAAREGNSLAEAGWFYRMSERSANGDKIARETVERIANQPPSTDELEAMREHPDAYASEFLERWKELLP